MNRRSLLIVLLIIGATICSSAQMPGPGAKRDMEKIRAMQKESVLHADSVRLTDRVMVVDPETGAAAEQVVVSVYSVYDYCQQLLGINSPDKLLDGQPMEITDPATYQTITIRWNASEARIDTIPQ